MRQLFVVLSADKTACVKLFLPIIIGRNRLMIFRCRLTRKERNLLTNYSLAVRIDSEAE